MAWENQIFSSYFILLGIVDHSPIHTFFFSLVLCIFTVAFKGNIAMVPLIYLDTHLHTPMYFLLSQLSLMDLMLISTAVPKMAFNYLSVSNSITVAGCATKIFFYVSLLCSVCFLLAVMVYDRYVVICHPLRYPNLMIPIRLGLMATSSCILGSTDGVIDAIATFSFSYCGSWVIPHFFCDFPSVLKLLCNNTSAFEKVFFICCILMMVLPVAFIVASYTCLLAVISMGSREGRRKVFAMFSSHLMVVGMYYGRALFIYILPTSHHSLTQDKMVSIFYIIFTP